MDLSALTKRITASGASGRVELDRLRLSMAIAGSATRAVDLDPDDAVRLGTALIQHASNGDRPVRVVAAEASIEA